MMHTVRLMDNTAGKLPADSIDHVDPELLIGEQVKVRLHDENGHHIERVGVLAKVLISGHA